MEPRMKGEMKIENTALDNALVSRHKSRGLIRKALLTPMVCSILASVGIFGGISSLFVGLVCVLIHGLVSADTVFDRVGTALLIAAIPMILVGSIFLDEIEVKK